MTTVSVHVDIGGTTVHAGTMYCHRRRSAESATFSYESEYLRRHDSFALDPQLPLSPSPFQTSIDTKIFRAFGDCAPDRWGRRLIARQEVALAKRDGRQPRSLGEVDFLLGVRDDLRQGAIRFRQGDGLGSGPFLATDDTGVPVLTDLPALLDLAQRAERDTADLPDLMRLIRVGGSLGGARPKAHVLDMNGRVAIAKFPSSDQDTWNVMAWEKVAFDLARDSGVDVPASQLLRLSGRSVHIIERFDRSAEGLRIGYASAMTMLEASDGEERSYLEIADVIERTSTSATEELHQLWRRIVFSILIANTDDHLRNHGFLHEQGDAWHLSPGFDLNPNPDPSARYLSTCIDDSRSDLDVNLALTVADYFRMSSDLARDVIAEVASSVSRWRNVAYLNGLSKVEADQMEPAFSALEDVA